MSCSLPISVFVSGEGLPSVSVISGEAEGVGLVKIRAIDRTIDNVGLIFAIFGPLIALLALVAGRTLAGYLPMSESEAIAARRRRLTLRWLACLYFAGLAVLLAVNPPSSLEVGATFFLFGVPVLALLISVATAHLVPQVVLQDGAVEIVNASDKFGHLC